MPRRKQPRPPMPVHAMIIPFDTAEEAWFWYMQFRAVNRAGMRTRHVVRTVGRPCYPVDIYRVVKALYRDRQLHPSHIRVLADFGARGCPPDERVAEQRWEATQWQQAMTLIENELIQRFIVIPANDNDVLGVADDA